MLPHLGPSQLPSPLISAPPLSPPSSSLILRVLSDSYKNKKKFRVIVVDSRPKLEGKPSLSLPNFIA